MTNDKVQGEGDYEGARHYRKATEETIRKRTRDGQPIRGNPDEATDELTPAEREGRSRAKGMDQDQRDKQHMDELEDEGRKR